jgi:hypothetical protein
MRLYGSVRSRPVTGSPFEAARADSIRMRRNRVMPASAEPRYSRVRSAIGPMLSMTARSSYRMFLKPVEWPSARRERSWVQRFSSDACWWNVAPS